MFINFFFNKKKETKIRTKYTERKKEICWFMERCITIRRKASRDGISHVDNLFLFFRFFTPVYQTNIIRTKWTKKKKYCEENVPRKFRSVAVPSSFLVQHLSFCCSGLKRIIVDSRQLEGMHWRHARQYSCPMRTTTQPCQINEPYPDEWPAEKSPGTSNNHQDLQ